MKISKKCVVSRPTKAELLIRYNASRKMLTFTLLFLSSVAVIANAQYFPPQSARQYSAEDREIPFQPPPAPPPDAYEPEIKQNPVAVTVMSSTELTNTTVQSFPTESLKILNSSLTDDKVSEEISVNRTSTSPLFEQTIAETVAEYAELSKENFTTPFDEHANELYSTAESKNNNESSSWNATQFPATVSNASSYDSSEVTQIKHVLLSQLEAIIEAVKKICDALNILRTSNILFNR
ncbi:hypothetical protein T4E_6548 [Trichinella pseudospiralis]|uniref:Uncharacterized protein n=1 Tax=Trichinella pseudospiralis TaxID=6337 RepID=A0A0V0YG18_TRIPS|nr:hypothetical protein T4E_6548 [Trichinella pseudospiralis]